MSSKIRILFYIPALQGGGAEKVLINMVNHMDQNAFDITVATEFYDKASERLKDGIHYKAIFPPCSGWKRKAAHSWFRLMTTLGLTYSLYLKDSYDIETAYLEFGATKVIASSKNQKALKLAWVHCDLSKHINASAVPKLKKQYRNFDQIVCVSNDVLKSFTAFVQSEIPAAVLYNIIDEQEILAKAEEPLTRRWKQDRVRLLSVGRLTAQKGFDDLIEIASWLKKDGCSFELKILGKGEDREKLQKLIDDLDLQDTVELCGYCNNPYNLLASADIAVCSSRYEGFSTFILEVLILGKCIVTRDCTGMKEMLDDAGIITGMAKEDLYAGLKTVLNDEKLRKQYASCATERGKLFYSGRLIGILEGFLKEAVKRKKV